MQLNSYRFWKSDTFPSEVLNGKAVQYFDEMKMKGAMF